MTQYFLWGSKKKRKKTIVRIKPLSSFVVHLKRFSPSYEMPICLFGYLAKFTLHVSQVHFAKLQSLHCYLVILLSWLSHVNCQLHFENLGSPHCPILQSTLPSSHSQVSKSTSMTGEKFYVKLIMTCLVGKLFNWMGKCFNCHLYNLEL